MDRDLSYVKCEKCGKDFFVETRRRNECKCECGYQLYYREEVEYEWLNEVDNNGDRVRMDFSGSSEEDCRYKAASYFGCQKQDIQGYRLVQKGGLFKKYIIIAKRPTKYELDENATRILMWEYDGRPSVWADINLEEQTILYPRELGEEKQKYDKIIELRKIKDSGACKDFVLVLEPQGEVRFSFYPGYTSDIDKLIGIGEKYTTPISHGIFMETLSCRVPFDAEWGVYLEIESNDFKMNGKMSVWKKEEKICILDPDQFVGIELSINDIKFYRLIGQKYVTTEITGGGGGGSSVKGAIIGGLIAGDAGAIIGSRQTVDAVKGTSTIHDEQVVLVYSNDLSQVITFNSNAYKIFTKLIPEKDYEIVTQGSNEQANTEVNNTKNNADAMREYKRLLDEGIINQEEFDKKKKQLLGL